MFLSVRDSEITRRWKGKDGKKWCEVRITVWESDSTFSTPFCYDGHDLRYNADRKVVKNIASSQLIDRLNSEA